MLRADGEPLVSDFGLAKLLDSDAHLTSSGTLLGTPAYMAPEQAAGDVDRISVRTDVWALGVILYELLTAQRPFDGKTKAEVIPRILGEIVRPPHAVCSSVPRPLSDITMKCLAKAPRERYETAAELADHLTAWVAGRPRRLPRPTPQTALGRLIHRPVTRREAVISATGLAVAGVIGWELPDLVGSETRAQRRVRRDIEERIRRRESVTLIPLDGPPAWSRTVFGNPQVRKSEEGQYTVACKDKPALIELVPAPPSTHYRLRAKVRHNNGERGYVGIYVGRAGPFHDSHWAFGALFADCGREATTPRVNGSNETSRAGAMFVHFALSSRGPAEATPSRASRYFAPTPGTWRNIGIEVSVGEVKVTWEAEELGTLAGHELLRHANYGRTGDPISFPAFAPDQGIGLYVGVGEASFADVIIEPAEVPIPLLQRERG